MPIRPKIVSFKTRYNFSESDKTNGLHAQLQSTKYAYLNGVGGGGGCDYT